MVLRQNTHGAAVLPFSPTTRPLPNEDSMITYHCSVCGAQVERNAFCKEHPRGAVQRIKHNTVHTLRLIWHESPVSELWRRVAENHVLRGHAPASAKEMLMAFRVQGYANFTIDESNELLDWAASLSGWETGDEETPNPISSHQREDICYSCGAEDLSPVEDPAKLSEADWALLEPLHAVDCPWILSRGNTRDLSLN
jgi:hypothetical protein